MNTLIDLPTLHAAVTAMVAAEPERTNNGACTYTRYFDPETMAERQCNCIAGVAMVTVGAFDVAELAEFDRSNSSAINDLEEQLLEVFTPEAVLFLDALQSHADNRFTHWGLGHRLTTDDETGWVAWADALDGAEATGTFYADLGLGG